MVKFSFPHVNLHSFDLTNVDLTKLRLPHVDVPQIKLPHVNLPHVDLPSIKADAIPGLVQARDLGYTAVGFAVLGFQKAQVRRREIEEQLRTKFSSNKA